MAKATKNSRNHKLLFRMENVECHLIKKYIACYIGQTYENETCDTLQWNPNQTILTTQKNKVVPTWVCDFSLDCDTPYIYSDLKNGIDYSYYDCRISYKQDHFATLEIRAYLQHRNSGGEWRRMI